MTQLLILILDDMNRLPDILDIWHSIGVPGVTILQSTGGHRTKTWLSEVGLGALDRLFDTDEIRRRTLLAAFEDEDLLYQAVAEAERVLGGFERPNSGILLVIPITLSKGISKRVKKISNSPPPPAVQPDWLIHRSTKVEEVLKILDLEATIVQEDTTINDVAIAMLNSPKTHVACVVNEAGRLTGLLPLHKLADDLFFHIMPEEFLSEMSDLEDVFKYAEKSCMVNAADAMQEPVWVKLDDQVKEAFVRMHEHDLPGLPVVDKQYQVIGYINLLELLAICVENNQENNEGCQ